MLEDVMTVRTRSRHIAVAFLITLAAAGYSVAQSDATSMSGRTQADHAPAGADHAPAGADHAPANVLHVAELGTCPTQAGDVVRDCHVAYRAFGRLNALRDNAVLIPTWYGGTSERLVRLLGDGGVVDTTRYFAILVDALGNGVSTSPSTSSEQPGAAFPALTIADMVVAQHRLVKEHLQLPVLHAVVGFSMGAMQALEWAVRFPDDARRVVSLLGTPRFAAHDVVTFRTLRNLVHLAELSDASGDSAWVPLAEFWHVVRATPDRVNELTVDRLDQALPAQAAHWREFDARDNRVQIEAMLRHDVAAPFGGDLARAAAAVTAELLVVVSPDDRIVGPLPALQFAELTGGEGMSVPSECGHFALYCEPAIGERVRAFLAEGAPAR
jgi:homoserine O-acetyltransferase/O-succinyltransferase